MLHIHQTNVAYSPDQCYIFTRPMLHLHQTNVTSSPDNKHSHLLDQPEIDLRRMIYQTWKAKCRPKKIDLLEITRSPHNMTRPKRPTFRIYEARQINHTSINTTDIYIYTKQSDQLKPTFNPDSINQISQTAPNHSRQSNLRDQTTTSLLCWKNPHSLSKMERKPWPGNQTDKSDWIKVDSMTFDLDSSIIYVQVET